MTSSSALALLLADARLPVAGHTQSGGLEPALGAGEVDVPGFIALRQATVVRTEAATAVVARAHVLRGEGLDAVVDAWAARTPSAAMRGTSRTLGRGLLRVGRSLWPLPHLPPGAPRPVVLGAIAAVAGVDARALVEVVAYDDAQTVASAALKLRPLDPMTAAGWVVAALPEVSALAVELAGLTRADQVPATGSPWLEHLAEVHATTRRRLFSA